MFYVHEIAEKGVREPALSRPGPFQGCPRKTMKKIIKRAIRRLQMWEQDAFPSGKKDIAALNDLAAILRESVGHPADDRLRQAVRLFSEWREDPAARHVSYLFSLKEILRSRFSGTSKRRVS